MLNKKKVLFLSGTRADFGKLKSLMKKVDDSPELDLHIFATGMHMLSKYGMTVNEIEKSGFKSIYKYINHNLSDSMDVILAKTVMGLSDYVKELQPDMVVVHGDRVEALAGAIVGSLNNILVSHIEGGEVSGTIDELIRHSVSKMAHVHFVSNNQAGKRLMQLGEHKESIFEIGSPDLDIMMSKDLPTIGEVKDKYGIHFDKYAILMYHPVTTELEAIKEEVANLVASIIASGLNYVVIYPNNDHGSQDILAQYKDFENNQNIEIFPSIRFECFLTLLKKSEFMIGNSSAGVREAPFYGLPSINVGTRQLNRSSAVSIINANGDKISIDAAIKVASKQKFPATKEFGDGSSDELFISALNSKKLWDISKQKIFIDVTES
jgi:UDP-N-acetylglucosamine 2-epimerase (hydrolysing)